MKILIIKRDKIGDLLLTTPMLEHLHASRPDAEIHLLANDYNAWVVAENPDISRLWVYPRVKVGKQLRLGSIFTLIKQNWQIRREQYDVAIVANGSESPRAIERGLSSGAKRVIAYVDDVAAAKSRYPGLTDALAIAPQAHESDRMLAMLAPLGIAMPSMAIWPRYTLPAQWQAFAKNWLAEQRLTIGGYVILGLGARRAKKQPTREQILRWSVRLFGEYGLKTVFMWTPGKSDNPLYPGDDEVAQPVLDAGSPHVVPFRGALMPAIALIWHSRTNIFPDSGLMHFAAASPGGVLGLFAETDVSPHPDQWGPRGPYASWLEAEKHVGELADEVVFAKLASNLNRR